MKSYLANIPSATYTIVELEKKVKEYSFEVNRVNQSKVKLIIWLPKYDEQIVELKFGTTTTVNLTKKGKPRGTIELTFK